MIYIVWKITKNFSTSSNILLKPTPTTPQGMQSAASRPLVAEPCLTSKSKPSLASRTRTQLLIPPASLRSLSALSQTQAKSLIQKRTSKAIMKREEKGWGKSAKTWLSTFKRPSITELTLKSLAVPTPANISEN